MYKNIRNLSANNSQSPFARTGIFVIIKASYILASKTLSKTSSKSEILGITNAVELPIKIHVLKYNSLFSEQ